MTRKPIRLRLGNSISPLKSRVYLSREGDLSFEEQLQVFGSGLFKSLTSSMSLGRTKSALQISASISPDWLPALLELALPKGTTRTHSLRLLQSRVADLSAFLVSEVVCVEVDLPKWLDTTPESFIEFFDDLFEPLGWIDVDGKRYGTTRVRTKGGADEKRQESKSKSKARKRPEPSKSEPPKPSLWDLIYDSPEETENLTAETQSSQRFQGNA